MEIVDGKSGKGRRRNRRRDGIDQCKWMDVRVMGEEIERETEAEMEGIMVNSRI